MNRLKNNRIIFLIIMSAFLWACDEGNDDDKTPPNNMGEGSWSMGNYIYERGTSSQATSKPILNGPDLRTFVITTSGPGNLGVFSGSLISGYLYEFGAGEYQVVNRDFFMEKGHTGKYIHFSCQIGTATATGSTQYISQNTNEIIKVTVQDNSYVLTTSEEIVLNKGLEVNGGVSGASSSYPFKAKSVF